MNDKELLTAIYNTLNEGDLLEAKRTDLIYRISMVNHLLAQALELQYPLPQKIGTFTGIDAHIIPGDAPKLS